MDEDALDHVATMSDHVTDAEHFDKPKALRRCRQPLDCHQGRDTNPRDA